MFTDPKITQKKQSPFYGGSADRISPIPNLTFSVLGFLVQSAHLFVKPVKDTLKIGLVKNGQVVTQILFDLLKERGRRMFQENFKRDKEKDRNHATPVCQ